MSSFRMGGTAVSTVAFAIVLCLTAVAGAQDDVYTLGFTGPASVAGEAETSVPASAMCTLTHEGPGDGAQAWSVGVELTGGVMMGARIDGTTAGTQYANGFNKTAVIDPEKNDGKQGATSAVVLCLECPALSVLPADATILALDFEVAVPADDGSDPAPAVLEYVDGLVGDGSPVQTIVTQRGTSFAPGREALEIDVVRLISCLDAPYAVGFSTDRVLSTTPFDPAVIGTSEPNHPSAAGLELAASEGEGASGRVDAVVISNDPTIGVQGWSLSIEALGDAAITAVTREDTSSADEPDGRFNGGFGKTELATPDDNDGRSGVVSAIVLCFGCGATLEPVGSESVVQMTVESAAPISEAAPQSGALVYAPLTGSGQVVQNVLTVQGSSVPVCNLEFARLDIDFALSLGVGPFIRGDANDDKRVDIADGIWIINELFKEGTPSPCQAAADANGTDTIDLADAVYIFSYRFTGGDAPPAPFPACDFVDPDATTLTCDPGNSSCL